MPVRLLGAVWLSAFLVSLDYTALNVALPTLSADFQVGTASISWIALSYMLALTALTPLAGHAIDRLGYARALAVGLTTFALASLASALAASLAMLVALRALQGVGAAVMFVVGPFVVRTAIPETERDRAFALYATAPTAGLCAGPALGGLLTEAVGWQAVFVFNLAAAALALALLRAARRELPQRGPLAPVRSSMPDPASAVLATAGLLALLIAVNRGSTWSWTSSPIVALFVAAATALLAVAARERRATTPLFDHEVLATRDFAVSALVFVPILMVFGGSVFMLPFYLEWLRDLDPAAVGHLMLVMPLATILASNLSGFVLVGTDRRLVCMLGIALFASGSALVAALPDDASLAITAAALFVMGAGAGLYYPTLIQVGMASVPSRLAAAAASLQSAVRVLAQMLGIVILEAIFSQLDPAVLDPPAVTAVAGPAPERLRVAFEAVFWCGAVLAALALPLAGLLRAGSASVAHATAE